MFSNLAHNNAEQTVENNEFHEFEVDKAIINDLIHAQNGTIATALRELIMNAIDAGSTTCIIALNKQGFSIADTGAGFADKASIEQVFKRFGEPHQEGDAVFGRFRIGRGQIMGFGVITWHSNSFKMHTDVRHRGNGFQLVEDDNDTYQGCTVSGTFYDPIDDWDLRSIKEELSKLVKFADLDISLNGISLTTDEQIEWDIEDDELKIKWCPQRRDGIMLYSQGVFVKEIPRYSYGLDADIITKRQLKLNMARNEISEVDPLWKKIDQHLKAQSLTIAKKSQRMSEETRKSVIYQLVGRQVHLYDVMHLPLLKDCRGRCISLKTLAKNLTPLTVAPKGSRLAEKLAARKTIFVFAHDELRLWDVSTLEQWVENLLEQALENRYTLMRYDQWASLTLLDFDSINTEFDESMVLLSPSKLPVRVAAARSAIAYASGVMSKRITKHSDYEVNKRKIFIGESDVADGWTDGMTYIAVNMAMTTLLDSGYYGAVQLSLLLLHEYCHDSQDHGSHEHDFDFFERYHDLSSTYRDEIVGHTATSLFNRYLSELGQRKEMLPKEVVKNFKWPVVNESIEVTGVLKGKLSPLAKAVLDLSPLRYRANGARFTAVSSRCNDGYGRVSAYMEKQFIEAGLAIPDERFIHRMADNYQAANTISKKEWATIYAQYAQLHSLDVEIVTRLHRNCSNANTFLQTLCMDSTGLTSFEYLTLTSMTTLNGADFSHTLPLYSHRNYQYQGFNTEDMASSSTKRAEFALKRINSVINGINNPIEKQAFLSQFLSTDGINALELMP